MNIYSTVPTKDMKGHPIDRNRLLTYLKALPDKFVTVKTIGQDCDFQTKSNGVRIREAITKLIEIDHQPIVSNGKGFTYTKNPERIQAYIDTLFARTSGIHRRIAAYSLIQAELKE